MQAKGQGEEEIAAAFFVTLTVVKQRLRLASVAPALLASLVSEKLQSEADVIRAKGWKWVDVALDLPYGYHHGLRHLVGTPALLTDDEDARHTILLAKYQALELEYSEVDEYPEEVDARLGEIDAAMEAIHVRPDVLEQDEIGRAGAFLTFDHDGRRCLSRLCPAPR